MKYHCDVPRWTCFTQDHENAEEWFENCKSTQEFSFIWVWSFPDCDNVTIRSKK